MILKLIAQMMKNIGHIISVLRIRWLFCPLNSGSGIGKKSRPGSRIRDEHPGPYFQELRNSFWVKYLNSLMRIRIRDPESF